MRPDLILMDITLKGDMDGISAAVCIQERTSIPLVYMTAHGDRETLHRAKMTEPLGYIIKPFNEQDLAATVEVALKKHHMVETRETAQREHAKQAVTERTVELADRHRELAALNSAFRKHLKVRDEESENYRELQRYVKDAVNRIQESLDELSYRLRDGNIDNPISDEETSSP